MEEHPFEVEVQSSGCAVLQHHAVDGEGRWAILQSGAACQVVRAMRDHIENVGVQRWGCATLLNLAASKDSRDLLSEEDVARSASGALGGHTLDCTVQRWGMGLVMNLAFSHRNREVLFKHGAVECVLAGMRCHRRNLELLRWGCGAARNLTRDSPAAQRRLVALEGGLVVVAAMQEFPLDLELQRWGVAVVYHLTQDAASRPRLRSAAFVQALCKAARGYRRDLEVRRRSFAALAALAEDDENLQMMRELGCVRLLNLARKDSDKEVLRVTARAWQRLAVQEES
uniref:Armadillo repeat-containing protein 8 n=1 Tax=Noctiluca scintillans TaxID=2966 RepID=A0A7S1A834_NOCSC